MRYFVIITDKTDAEHGISGDTTLGPFGTYKDARAGLEREMQITEKLCINGRKDFTAKIMAA